ncbi:hypothetical protein P153DRAFT_319338, partial [Dothidotthia symphoricarpi CBS 119687]
MPPQNFLDTHIHLWPSTATSPRDHAWMTPNHFLAARHGITDYEAVATPPPSGFIYVETDRYLPALPAELSSSSHSLSQSSEAALESWAAQPLEELRFLRRIAENAPAEGDGFSSHTESARMKGAVVWAPLCLSTALFELYLRIAERVAGPVLWARIVGFRFLLQGKGEGEVARLTGSAEWVSNMVLLGRGRGGKGWAFDVGVDVHRDGVGVLGEVAGMIERVREAEAKKEGGGEARVRFVLNHLCKPDLSPASPTPTPQYLTALTRLAPDPNIYIKLSGPFNEFTPSPTPSTVPALLDALRPTLDVVVNLFPGRIMFGSDWPVCNVGGPKGEAGNWAFWVEAV